MCQRTAMKEYFFNGSVKKRIVAVFMLCGNPTHLGLRVKGYNPTLTLYKYRYSVFAIKYWFALLTLRQSLGVRMSYAYSYI